MSIRVLLVEDQKLMRIGLKSLFLDYPEIMECFIIPPSFESRVISFWIKEDMKDFTYLDVLHKIFDDMNVPVIYDIDFGHLAPQWTIINGSYAEFEYENGKGKIKQIMK